jgi:hypothetical protein
VSTAPSSKKVVVEETPIEVVAEVTTETVPDNVVPPLEETVAKKEVQDEALKKEFESKTDVPAVVEAQPKEEGKDQVEDKYSQMSTLNSVR